MCIRDRTGNEGNVAVFSDLGVAKLSKLAEYEVQGRNGKGLKTFQWAKSNANGTSPVSYTHLDVYKRQMEEIHARIIYC